MRARFKTNLDEAKRFVRDTFDGDHYDACDYLVGDRIAFEVFRGNSTKKVSFELEVVSRCHHPVTTDLTRSAYTEIELHMVRPDNRSIKEWSEWFREHVRGG